jgi:hypothetical protein
VPNQPMRLSAPAIGSNRFPTLDAQTRISGVPSALSSSSLDSLLSSSKNPENDDMRAPPTLTSPGHKWQYGEKEASNGGTASPTHAAIAPTQQSQWAIRRDTWINTAISAAIGRDGRESVGRNDSGESISSSVTSSNRSRGLFGSRRSKHSTVLPIDQPALSTAGRTTSSSFFEIAPRLPLSSSTRAESCDPNTVSDGGFARSRVGSSLFQVSESTDL